MIKLLATGLKRNNSKNLIYLSHSNVNLDSNLNKINIFSHPWKSYNVFVKDSKKIENIYEYSVNFLKKELNQISKSKYDTRGWKILIGPWLHCFIVAYYEKNILIEKLLKKKEKIKIPSFSYKTEDFIPSNFDEFFHIMTENNDWQNYLLAEILKEKKLKKNLVIDKKKIYLTSPRFDKKKTYLISSSNKQTYLISKDKKKSQSSKTIKDLFLNFFRTIAWIKIKNQKIIYFNTYFGLKKNFLFSLKNFSIPGFFIQKKIFNSPNISLRQDLLRKIKTNDKILKKILTKIIINIPTDYLENFEEIKKTLVKNQNKKTPHAILTTTGFYFDTFKAMFAMNNISQGTKIILMQHGGNKGHHKISFTDKYEIEISDFYCTWGWKSSLFKNKVVPLGLNKNIEKIKKYDEKINSDNNGKLLFIIKTNRRFTKYLDYDICAENIYNYYTKFCFNFYQNLNNSIKKKVLWRLHKGNWNELDFFKKKFNQINFSDRNNEDFEKVISQSKLTVCSYLSTTFLECLASNKPVILTISSPLNIYNKKTIKYLKILEKGKIFFRDEKKLVKFVNANWNNLNSWWVNKSLQKARGIFIKEFIYENNNYLNSLNKLIGSR